MKDVPVDFDGEVAGLREREGYGVADNRRGDGVRQRPDPCGLNRFSVAGDGDIDRTGEVKGRD